SCLPPRLRRARGRRPGPRGTRPRRGAAARQAPGRGRGSRFPWRAPPGPSRRAANRRARGCAPRARRAPRSRVVARGSGFRVRKRDARSGSALLGLVEEAAAHRIVAARDVALREHDLEEVRAARRRAEHLGTAIEVHAPHAPEMLVEALRVDRLDARPVAIEPFRPGVERERVVAAEVLDVHDLEPRVLHLGDDLRETGDPATREDVLANVELRVALPDVADEMQHAEAAALEERGMRAHHLRDLVAAGVLERADRDDLVVLAMHLAEIRLDHVERAFEPAARDLAAQPLDLLGGGVEAGDLRAVELLGMEHEAAKAAADVDHGLARGEAHLAAHVLDLVALRLLDGARALAPISARVHHELAVEP